MRKHCIFNIFILMVVGCIFSGFVSSLQNDIDISFDERFTEGDVRYLNDITTEFQITDGNVNWTVHSQGDQFQLEYDVVPFKMLQTNEQKEKQGNDIMMQASVHPNANQDEVADEFILAKASMFDVEIILEDYDHPANGMVIDQLSIESNDGEPSITLHEENDYYPSMLSFESTARKIEGIQTNSSMFTVDKTTYFHLNMSDLLSYNSTMYTASKELSGVYKIQDNTITHLIETDTRNIITSFVNYQDYICMSILYPDNTMNLEVYDLQGNLIQQIDLGKTMFAGNIYVKNDYLLVNVCNNDSNNQYFVYQLEDGHFEVVDTFLNASFTLNNSYSDMDSNQIIYDDHKLYIAKTDALNVQVGVFDTTQCLFSGVTNNGLYHNSVFKEPALPDTIWNDVMFEQHNMNVHTSSIYKKGDE